jgi:hypothetical protein
MSRLRARSWRWRWSLVLISVHSIESVLCGQLTLEGGSETGSNEKFSMRLAWQRDFCSVDDKLRSSSSAAALKGPSASRPAPVRSHSPSTAFSGSISWLTSLKRTDGGWSWAVDAMVGDG